MAIKTSEKETQVSDKQDNEDQQQLAEKAPTAEELKATVDENLAEWFDNDRLSRSVTDVEDGDKKEVPVEKAAEKPVEKTEEKVEKKDEKEQPKETGKLALVEEGKPVEAGKETAPAPARGLSDDEIEEVADRIVARTRQDKPVEKEQPKDPFVGFDGQEREQLQAVDFLAKRDPRFKGRDLVKETTQFWNAEQAYIQQWEKSHSGEAFNPDDPDHAAFYQKTAPAGLSDGVIDKAQIDMEVSRQVAEARNETSRKMREEIDQRLAPIEREKAIAQAAPEVAKSINGAVAEMVSGILPDMVGENGLTKEIIEKIEAEDPVVMELLSEESGVLNVRIRELENLRHLGDRFEFNPDRVVNVSGQSIKPHSDIIDTAVELEQNISALPDADRINDGRMFITREGRSKLIADVMKSDLSKEDKSRRIERINSKTWSIDFDDIRAAMITKSVKSVKKTLDIANKRAEHTAKKNGKQQEKPVEGKVEQRAEKKASAAPAPITGQSDLVDTRIPGGSGAPSQTDLNTKWAFD